MDDAFAVCLLESRDDLGRDADGLVDGHGAAPQTVGERLAVDPLEDEIGRTVQVFEPVDRRDVGMAERGEHARFALEAPQARRIAAEGRGPAP